MRALFSPGLTALDRLLEYAGNHPWLASAAVLAALAVIVFELRARSSSIAAVTPQDLIRLMNGGALVLDIRTPDLYAAGHIGGSRHMPSDQILKANETLLKKHKEKAVVVYDESGSLGAAAVRQLASQGFTRAVSLRGGIVAWRAENLPVVKA
ncbi:MAG TPA: rhodanese-like domain-containing protein [Steroidobacteraceae bacterium]|nr:rhodanese-like domain-containing protein [Steroidobacteraceae bacterium]